MPSADPQAKLDVLRRRQRAQQVVLLEDEANALADGLERAAARAVELLAEDADAARLRRAQCAHQRQQRGLAGAGGSGDDDDLAGRDAGADIEQYLALQRATAVMVVKTLDDDGQRCTQRQKTSAGSSLRTLRSAMKPDSMHMDSVSRKTARPRSGVRYSGSRVALAAAP